MLLWLECVTSLPADHSGVKSVVQRDVERLDLVHDRFLPVSAKPIMLMRQCQAEGTLGLALRTGYRGLTI